MRLALVAALLLMAGGSAGCFACHDQLDVHRCREETGRCDLAGQVVVDWSAERERRFPDIGRLMDAGIEPGKHRHADWTPEQAEEFWSYHGVPLDRDDKQVFVRSAGELYHVRILAC